MDREKNDALKTEKKEKKKQQMQGPKGQRSRRWLFLVADILLLAAIVGAVIFLVSLLTPDSGVDSDLEEERKITYTVEFSGVGAEVLDALKKGDAVVDMKTGALIGEVVDASVRSYEVFADTFTEGENGKIVDKATYPDDYGLRTLTVRITTTAGYQSGVGYTVQGCRIAVGRSYQIKFPQYTGSGVCIDFRAE